VIGGLLDMVFLLLDMVFLLLDMVFLLLVHGGIATEQGQSATRYHTRMTSDSVLLVP